MRRAPYINLMKGLIGAWCPSVGVAGGSIVTDRTQYYRNLQLSTYEAGSGFGASGTGIALDFHPGWGGAYTYDVTNVPYYLTDQRLTVSAWHNTRSYDDGLGYNWNNAIFEIVTDYTFNGQRFILQNSYDSVNDVTYVFTDGVFAENNLSVPGPLPLNQWIHFCMVIDTFSYRFFVNGNLNQSGNFATDYNLDFPLYLNVGYRDGWDNFDGYIDDVRLYNRTLSDAEVHQLATRRGIGLEAKRWRRPLRLPDLSDLWDFSDTKKRNQLTVKEEEQIAAQLLLERQKKNLPAIKKKLINWKQLLFEQINNAETVEELDAIEAPQIVTESVEVTAAVLAEVARQKELKRLQLQLKKQELQLKEQQITEVITQQQQVLKATRALYKEVLARHKLAMQQALQIEQKAALEAYQAELQAAEFNKKREQRIKRLKALMWLTKLDL